MGHGKQMWNYILPLDSETIKGLDRFANFHGVKLLGDDRTAIFVIAEAAGYAPPTWGVDHYRTFEVALGTFCFLPWHPPKVTAEAKFIAERRAELFKGASNSVTVCIHLTARVNKLAFERVKTGDGSLRPFDLFNFVS